jgi:hypothetical protein
MDGTSQADLLQGGTAERHGSFEAVAQPHDWWDWYAAYMDARQRGSRAPNSTSTRRGTFQARRLDTEAPPVKGRPRPDSFTRRGSKASPGGRDIDI